MGRQGSTYPHADAAVAVDDAVVGVLGIPQVQRFDAHGQPDGAAVAAAVVGLGGRVTLGAAGGFRASVCGGDVGGREGLAVESGGVSREEGGRVGTRTASVSGTGKTRRRCISGACGAGTCQWGLQEQTGATHVDGRDAHATDEDGDAAFGAELQCQ